MALVNPVLSSVLQVFFTFLGTLMLFFEIIRKPLSFFRTKTRNVPPPCLMDSSLGTHEYVTANGIKFHCVSKGDTSKPLMLFLHGFPEFWFSWRYQLKEFCRDYRVVAIDMRGYGETDKPVGVHQYTMDLLKQDIIELIKVLSPSKKCILVAHDWGGLIAWESVQNCPDLFEKLIVMNCPHPKVFERALKKGWKQVLKSGYIFLFQSPFLPEMLLSVNDYGAFNGMGKMVLHNTESFSADVIEAVKYNFSPREKLTPPLNYYRNLLSHHFQGSGPIDLPTLLVWGENDIAFDLSLSDEEAYRDLCTDITIKHIPNCSHDVQLDHPELTNQYMREFLRQQQ